MSVIPQGVTEKIIGSIFKAQEIPEHSLTIKCGTDRLFRNVGKELTSYGA